MIGLKLLLVLFFTAWPLQRAECETIHIVPRGGSCRGAPTGVRCSTLQQYFNSPSSSSNIHLELQPGSHSLEIGSGYGLEVSDVDNFTMVSNGGILDCSEYGRGGRVFFDGHHHIYIRDSRYVYIGPMTAIDCQSYFLHVNEVVIEGGSFNAISGRTRPAITLSNVNNAIIRGWSCSNYNHELSGGCFNLSTSTLQVLDGLFTDNRAATGGVVNVEGATSSLTVERCSFRNNSGIDGGVFRIGTLTLLTIANSTFSDNSATSRGGVVFYESVSGQFMACGSNFTNNSANVGGAVYFITGGLFTFFRDNFISNSAISSGGAIYLLGGDSGVELILSTFANNVANVEGGGVSIRGNYVYLVISQSTFYNNTAIGEGGGALHYDVRFGNVSIVESDFSYNTALYCAIIDVDGFFQESINFTSSFLTNNRAVGEMPVGDITCIRNTTVHIMNSTLSHNSAAQHAGVFSIDGGIVTIVESSFTNNSAAGDGGVMYTYYYPTIYNIYRSTFSQNKAGDDGGVLFVGRADSEVRVHNSIFTENTAMDQGGIIAVVASTVMVNRTNLRGNSAASGGSISACNCQVSVGDIQDLQVRADPLNQVCTHYSGDIDRHSLSILQDYGMIESITPPVSWQCDSFHIVPSPVPDGDCPVELTGVPCFTLEDYYYNPSVAPNIYIELQAGNHNLDSGFVIEVFHTENFTMVSNGGTLDCSDPFDPDGRVVFDGHIRILVTHVRYVYIGQMNIINCQFVFERVNELVVEGGSFHGIVTTRPALSISTVTKAIVRQLFCSNYISCLNLDMYSTVLLSDSTFINNHGTHVVSMLMQANLTVERCSFRDNRGTISGVVFHGSGGVILSIICSNFSNNVAAHHGVIYINGLSTVNIMGSTFYNNTAIINGGVLYVDHSTLNVAGSNFSDNSAGDSGGVLYILGVLATVHIVNSTVSNNNAINTGGVGYVTGSSTLTISDTNLLNNTAVNGGSVIRACDNGKVTVASDLQTGTDPMSPSCTLYSGDIDHYNTTYNYCPYPSDTLTSTIGPKTLAVCSSLELPTYVPNTTESDVDNITIATSDGGKPSL